MSCYPKIDQPCPLSIDAQRRIAGYCSQCRKSVHALDALDASARTALLRDASGPICVSYRVPARIGAALMLSMAGALHAGEAADRAATDALPAPVATTTSIPEVQVVEPEEMQYIMVGGVSDPNAAKWVNVEPESTLPELPVIVEPAR